MNNNLNNRNELNDLVKRFQSIGYTIYSENEDSVILSKMINIEDNKDIDVDDNKDINVDMVYINAKIMLAEKYPATYSKESKAIINIKAPNIPFTKKELLLLDAFDYEIFFCHERNTGQNIYSHIYML
jgi:hypothetical protein